MIAGTLLLYFMTWAVIPGILIVASFEFFPTPWDWLSTTAIVAIDIIWLRLLIKGDS